MGQFRGIRNINPPEPANKKKCLENIYTTELTEKTESGLAAVWWGAEWTAKPKGLSKKRKLKGEIKNTNRMLKTAFNLRQMLKKTKSRP